MLLGWREEEKGKRKVLKEPFDSMVGRDTTKTWFCGWSAKTRNGYLSHYLGRVES